MRYILGDAVASWRRGDCSYAVVHVHVRVRVAVVVVCVVVE